MGRGVVLIGVLLAGAMLALLASTGGPRAPGSEGHRSADGRTAVEGGVALLDFSGVIKRTIAAGRIRQPYEARFEGGLFWVFDAGGPSIVAINPRTGQIARALRSPISDVGSYVVTHSAVWISDEQHGTVVAIDPRNGQTLRTIRHLPGSGGSVGVAIVDHSLWVARPEAVHGGGILAIINPNTGHVTGQIRNQPGSYELATDTDGTLWTGGTHGAVNHIQPLTRTVSFTNVGGRNYSITVKQHHLWTTDAITGDVYELNRTPSVIARYISAPGADTIAYGDGAAWVGNSHNGTVTRIAPSGHQDTYTFNHEVTAISAGDGLILVGFGKPLPNHT
jgi:hypothetical protein